MPPRAADAARPGSNDPNDRWPEIEQFNKIVKPSLAIDLDRLRENSRHRTAGARVKMGHGESNVPWGTRTAIAGARKLPKIRASNEIAIGLGLGFVGALPR